jgi:hypothetical protein
MQPPHDWPAPPEPLTREQRIERLVLLREAINDPNATVDLKQIFFTLIDCMLESLHN